MTFQNAAALVMALLVTVLPGLALLLALGVRRPVWLIGVSPAASAGVATLTATVCALVGVRFGLTVLTVVTAVLLVIGLVWIWRGRDRSADPAAGGRRWSRPAALRAGQLVGLVLVLGAVGLSVLTWYWGLGTLTTVNQEHDMIIHTVLTAYIERTGNGAPWQVLPTDVLSGNDVGFYPPGIHLLMAVASTLTGSTVVGMNSVTVMVLGVGWATSTAALGYVAARRARLGSSSALIAAGIAALVAVGLYRPVFSLMHEGGMLPNAAALVLTPGLLAGLLTIPRRGWAAGVAAGFGCAGLVAIHPSAVVTVGVSVLAWWIGEAFTKGGLRRIAGQLPPLMVTMVAALVAAAATLQQMLGASGGVSNASADISPTPFGTALWDTIALVYSGWITENRGAAQLAAFALTMFGVAMVLLTRRGIGALTGWLVWMVIVVAAWVSPAAGPHSLVTGFFYHAQLRVWSHVSLFAPVLAGLGVVLAASLGSLLLARLVPAVRPRVRWIALGVAGVVGLGYLFWPGLNYAKMESRYLATRYVQPDFTRVDDNDRAAIEWLAPRVQAGQRVLNSANDGSTFLYVEKGIPIVNATALGTLKVPYTYTLLAGFNRYPSDPQIRRMLRDLNVRWVYVDTDAPTIGAGSSPHNWVNGWTFSVAAGLTNLDRLPGLELGFRAGSVSVYSLNPAAIAAP